MTQVIEFFLTILILVLITPILLVIGLFILFFGGGWPVIFKQKRVGKDGQLFVLYKFRTMYPGAEKDQDKYREFNEAHGPVFKIRNDPRFTKIGKFLSHTGLDELPQLVNVSKGEMSLVGPRPLPVKEAKQLNKWQRKREQVKPGIISPWLFNGYHSSSFDQWMDLDLEYVKRKSLNYDLGLLIRGLKLAGGLIKRELVKLGN